METDIIDLLRSFFKNKKNFINRKKKYLETYALCEISFF